MLINNKHFFPLKSKKEKGVHSMFARWRRVPSDPLSGLLVSSVLCFVCLCIFLFFVFCHAFFLQDGYEKESKIQTIGRIHFLSMHCITIV